MASRVNATVSDTNCGLTAPVRDAALAAAEGVWGSSPPPGWSALGEAQRLVRLVSSVPLGLSPAVEAAVRPVVARCLVSGFQRAAAGLRSSSSELRGDARVFLGGAAV